LRLQLKEITDLRNRVKKRKRVVEPPCKQCEAGFCCSHNVFPGIFPFSGTWLPDPHTLADFMKSEPTGPVLQAPPGLKKRSKNDREATSHFAIDSENEEKDHAKRSSITDRYGDWTDLDSLDHKRSLEELHEMKWREEYTAECIDAELEAAEKIELEQSFFHDPRSKKPLSKEAVVANKPPEKEDYFSGAVHDRNSRILGDLHRQSAEKRRRRDEAPRDNSSGDQEYITHAQRSHHEPQRWCQICDTGNGLCRGYIGVDQALSDITKRKSYEL